MPAVARILREITEQRRRRLAEESGPPPPLAHEGLPGPQKAPVATGSNDFLAALDRRRGHAVIAEVKMGSPRLGSLVDRIDAEQQARIYAEHGAAALSVVVEPDFFYGSYELLERCRAASGLPAIAKDFIVHPLQIEWAAAAGADAVLLIAALMSAEELVAYASLARGLGLVPLVEIHQPNELDGLAGRPWELVGVNNRNLETFAVDIEHAVALAPQLPAGCLRVAESGIGAPAQVKRLRAAGFDAFLIGESLLLADDPGGLLAELVA